MKRLVLLLGFFAAGQSFVLTAKGAVNATSMAEELSIAETVKSGAEAATPKVRVAGEANVAVPTKGIGDANVMRADANAAREPNAKDLKAGMSEGLEKAFENVKQDGQREGREWLRFDAKERMGLVKTVQSQVMDELKMLRGIAAEEKAVKTTAAIDMLIADRKERYEKVLARMEAEDEKSRRREQLREERSRDREPRRNERQQERRSREIPPRRETEPNVGN